MIARSVRRGLGAALVATAFAVACRRSPSPELAPAAFRGATAGADWTLVEIAGGPAATGAGGRPATLRFDADSARVTGFAGCNRYFARYTLDGTALRFESPAMTRMACAEGSALEQQLAAALEATRRYELAGDRLTLVGDAGPTARFTRRAP